MKQLLLRLLINAVAIYITILFVPGIGFVHGGVEVGSLLLVALIFGLVNALIRPIIKLLTCPFYVLTLGLFTLVVNALMLMLTAQIANLFEGRFVVTGFGAALIGGIIIAIVSTVLSIFVSDDAK
jgi:putative membrane protein